MEPHKTEKAPDQFPYTLTPVWGPQEATVRRNAIVAIACIGALIALAMWFVRLAIAEVENPSPNSPMTTDPSFMIAVVVIVVSFMLIMAVGSVYSLTLRPWVTWKQDQIERRRAKVAQTDYPLTGVNLSLLHELLAKAGEDPKAGVQWHESLSQEGTVRFPDPVLVVDDDGIFRLEVGSRAVVHRRGSAAAQLAMLPAPLHVDEGGVTLHN